MQRYWWPGFEMQLLAKLQRQQNSAQFCDTLLQTEGISVPAHSCVLAALSPHLSHRLSASPPPPPGQRHLLRLQAVKARTLLKLVGLLYSGELELDGGAELDEVLAAARQFGIADLVEGRKGAGAEPRGEGRPRGGCRDDDSRSSGGESEAGRRDAAEKKSFTSTATQTLTWGEGSGASPAAVPSQSAPPTPDQQLRSAPCQVVPSILSGAPSDGASPHDRNSEIPPPPLSRDALAPVSDSGSPRPQEDSAEAAAGRGEAERADAGEPTGEGERGTSAERRRVHANVGTKSLAKLKQVQQMMATTQISIKVKLRRRTTGEAWEVVNVHDADETLSVLSCLKQDGSNVPPPPSAVQPPPTQRPGGHIPQPADALAPNQMDGLEAALLPQGQGSVEECDEQIEKLLEDIMMGLNILPNCKRPHHLQPHDGAPAVSQVPGTGSDSGGGQAHADVFFQDLGTQGCSSSIHTGLGCFAGQNSYPSMAAPSAFFPAGQRLHYPAFQELSTLDSQQLLDFLPLTNGSEAPSVSCLEDLRLPQCLSPLDPCASAAKRHPAAANPADPGGETQQQQQQQQQQPALHTRPWLPENPRSLRFSPGVGARRKNKSASEPADTRCCSWTMRWQEHLKPDPQKTGASAGPSAPKKPTRQRPAANPKSRPRKAKEGEPAGAAKRRKTQQSGAQQEAAAAALLPYKDVRLSSTKSPLNLSICQVSLSRNNVLAKEREIAASAWRIPSKFVGKPNGLSAAAAAKSLREKTGGPGAKGDKARTRTRGVSKNTRAPAGDTGTKNPWVGKALTGSQQGGGSHRPGRLPTEQHEDAERKTDGGVETRDPARRRCQKRSLSRGVEAVPQKKSASDAVPGETNGEPTRPQVATLKGLQALVKRQHSRIRRSRDSQDTDKAARDAESDGTAGGDAAERSQGDEALAVDENHNRVSREPAGEGDGPRRPDDDADGGGDRLPSPLGAPEEEVARLAAERETQLTPPDGGTTGVSVPPQQAARDDEGLAHTDAHLPQENKPPPDSPLPRTPEPIAPSLPGAGGSDGTSGCDQEEEEEEVDVVLLSPVRVPQTAESEDNLSITERTPDEEEEAEEAEEAVEAVEVVEVEEEPEEAVEVVELEEEEVEVVVEEEEVNDIDVTGDEEE